MQKVLLLGAGYSQYPYTNFFDRDLLILSIFNTLLPQKKIVDMPRSFGVLVLKMVKDILKVCIQCLHFVL